MAKWIPFGLGEQKPHHYLEMGKAVWSNRDNLGYAWRVLTKGVCDGCALGTSGLRDYTMDSTHLCLVRLDLLRLNTQPALDPKILADVSALLRCSGKALRSLGRLPYPMLRRCGDPGFRRITWEEALERCALRLRAAVRRDPSRIAIYLTSRGLTNETYYTTQKVARFLGTNNVDTSARLCHAPSTVGLKTTLGFAASTCSYKDWLGTDCLIFFGSNTPNNQPVTMKYIHYAKQQGTRVLVVNPFEEPGLRRYWVPSVAKSALWGTAIADEFYTVHTGGDMAFLTGALKHIIEAGLLDSEFIAHSTAGFDELRTRIESLSWEVVARQSGASRADMVGFGERIGRARSAVFVWSMGITQHGHGVDNVRAIVNLALARGFIGREKCGLMPIRGHSGVQGGAEVGAIPNAYAMDAPVGPESAARFARLWRFEPPVTRGLNAVEMLDAAGTGDLDVLYAIGGNFTETLPDPDDVVSRLRRIPFRIHQDIVLSSQMLVDPSDEVLLLPAKTRYEQDGGGTETTTERRILFSPTISGPPMGEAKSEWEIPLLIAQRVDPARASLITFASGEAVRGEIARAVPAYEGIQHMQRTGDMIQWGGERLGANGRFPTSDGRGHFSCPNMIERPLPPGHFFLSTRRGKQFNSMVHRARDPLTGAHRSDILMAPADAERLGLRNGASIRLCNRFGHMDGRVRYAPMRPSNLQAHWPEANVLLPRGTGDPDCGIPDYNAIVEVIPAPV